MSHLTATTTRPLVEISTSGQLPVAERAAYVYVGNGKFMPANAAARAECAAWNDFADKIMAGSAASRSVHL